MVDPTIGEALGKRVPLMIKGGSQKAAAGRDRSPGGVVERLQTAFLDISRVPEWIVPDRHSASTF